MHVTRTAALPLLVAAVLVGVTACAPTEPSVAACPRSSMPATPRGPGRRVGGRADVGAHDRAEGGFAAHAPRAGHRPGPASRTRRRRRLGAHPHGRQRARDPVRAGCAHHRRAVRSRGCPCSSASTRRAERCNACRGMARASAEALRAAPPSAATGRVRGPCRDAGRRGRRRELRHRRGCHGRPRIVHLGPSSGRRPACRRRPCRRSRGGGAGRRAEHAEALPGPRRGARATRTRACPPRRSRSTSGAPVRRSRSRRASMPAPSS